MPVGLVVQGDKALRGGGLKVCSHEPGLVPRHGRVGVYPCVGPFGRKRCVIKGHIDADTLLADRGPLLALEEDSGVGVVSVLVEAPKSSFLGFKVCDPRHVAGFHVLVTKVAAVVGQVAEVVV
jgi:hypothetical protein